MDIREIAGERLRNHGLAPKRFARAEDAVAWMGALQAQDYAASLWAVAVRTGETQEQVETAIASGRIVRTWPMRGTLHMVGAADVRWMLELMAPRAILKAAGRARQLEIDNLILSRARTAIERAIGERGPMTRAELYALLAGAGIEPAGQRGIHILGRLAHEGVLCVGPRRGKEPTFVLLDAWVPPQPPRPREDALAELAKRYFRSHGPATVHDLAWWSGLRVTEIREAVDHAKAELESESIGNSTFWWGIAQPPAQTDASTILLLPGFDEFVLGYTDRSVVLAPEHAQRIVPGGNGVFLATIVEDGRVVGSWRRSIVRGQAQVRIQPFDELDALPLPSLAPRLEEYGRFLGVPAKLAD